MLVNLRTIDLQILEAYGLIEVLQARFQLGA